MKNVPNLFDRLRYYILERLEAPVRVYEQRIYNNMDKLYRYIRKGDVLLVEGRSKMSRMIKLFTHSHWSHVGLYVGDELVREESEHKTEFFDQFGQDARHLVIEAFSGSGVIATPIRNYKDYNIRICRPYGISESDLETVIHDVISNLGKHYDNQNIIDLAMLLMPSFLNPFKKKTVKACLGNCNDFQVICSGMIARSFQRVGYPVVPALGPVPDSESEIQTNPYGSKLVMRHFSQIIPRDFDLSPNFAIIKFNIIEGGRFDYKSLWAEDVTNQRANESITSSSSECCDEPPDTQTAHLSTGGR
jgi:hypothetical protein